MNESIFGRAAGRGVCAAAVALSLVVALPGDARAQSSTEQRLNRIERMLESSAMVQLLDKVKRLEREVRDLRGEIEVQANTIARLKRNQVKLYDDIDQRLETVEQAPRAPAAPAVATAPQAAPSTPDRPAAAPAAAVGGEIDPVREQQDYQAAFNLLKTGRYEPAAEAFRGFLGKYSAGRYADNAQYWLGETYYVTRQFEPALREFDVLLDKYPDSQKRSHAMLKVGYIRDELGQKTQARRVLEDLIARFPNSTAAGLARKRLDRLGE